MLFRKLIEKKLTKYIRKEYGLLDGYFEIIEKKQYFYDKITIYKVRFGYKGLDGFVDFEEKTYNLNIQFLKGIIYSNLE